MVARSAISVIAMPADDADRRGDKAVLATSLMAGISADRIVGITALLFMEETVMLGGGFCPTLLPEVANKDSDSESIKGSAAPSA